ncbi:MAG: NrfD/PsrC family molybdoenzyme membrane anchor subunit, partial [Planctomycetota bacterium]
MLGVLVAIGLVVAAVRYSRGIGAVSNLSDARAWGLWVSFDLYCGVALAAGGFTLAFAVHILRLERYEPVVRPAVLTAFLGYLMVLLALLVDLGQPWRIWHITVFWNPRSPLFEVGWCVLLYTVVLALEFSPSVFERLRMERALRRLRRGQGPRVGAGGVRSGL